MNPPQNLDSTDADLLGVSPPEHGVLGHALIVLLYTAGPAGMLAVLVLEPWSFHTATSVVVGTAFSLAVGGFLAESLRRFECWAWFFTMLLFGGILLQVLLLLGTMSPAAAGGSMVVCIPLAMWMRYLWSRRLAFWSDSPARASRRPERRWVTAEWRAARLARIGSGRACLSRPDTFPG